MSVVEAYYDVSLFVANQANESTIENRPQAEKNLQKRRKMANLDEEKQCT
jgi:hypothetical protein